MGLYIYIKCRYKILENHQNKDKVKIKNIEL